MSLLALITLACALAMDAFAVAVAVGIALKKVSPRQTFRLAWHFGLFQAMMPVIGWFCGNAISGFVQTYAHWIACALLACIGGNMMREAFMAEEDRRGKDATRGLSLVMLSVATSIDALAVGFSMSLLQTPIALPALVIGLIAALFTTCGLHLGRLAASGKRLSRCAEIAGGLALWAIAVNILHEHGVF
ncbi:MAG: manganese efflux pump MntP family protein [Desulfobulbaceae bacterium]|jgi:putative Mn2+ efflux pump MntP|nr:manganese efflux pump MntP family protein [Desulfobulbaceae bacterium]